MSYRIRTVAEMTGIPRNTLIAWERRYGFVRPQRHENGYRSYSDADVAKLRRVQNALKAGLKISEAIGLLESEPAPEEKRREVLKSGGVWGEDGVRTLGDVQRELASALVNFERERADAILTQLSPVPFANRLREVFFPVLRMVGDMWASGEISVAQEHYASAVLRTHFAGILLGLGVRGRGAPHAACTTFVGEQHELAALALAIQLSLSGYRVSYLGPNLPASEAGGFCSTQGVDLLCVSLIVPATREAVESYLVELATSAGPGTRIVLGGSALADQGVKAPAGVEILPEWEMLEA